MQLTCPKGCAKQEFCVLTKVLQTWLCDNKGEFIDVVEDVTDVLQYPNSYSEWYCADCGSDAVAS